MLYKQRFDTFIRQYDNFGYIINKGNFSDRVVDASGAVFLSVLSREAKNINELAENILISFTDVDIETLKEDLIDFYSTLEDDGFIVSGETIDEIEQKDVRFSYSQLDSETINKNTTPLISSTNNNSKDFLRTHFKNNPHLISLQIELTSRCNERCVHCYIPHENKKYDIEPSLYYDVINQCCDMGLLSLTLSGGEPMMHNNFCDFLRKAKEYDFSVNILSNLTMLNDDIIKEMKENRLSSVQVSLYSMEPDIHDSITQLKGSFYKTKNNILKLIENDIPLQIHCPTMKQNISNRQFYHFLR